MTRAKLDVILEQWVSEIADQGEAGEVIIETIGCALPRHGIFSLGNPPISRKLDVLSNKLIVNETCAVLWCSWCRQ